MRVLTMMAIAAAFGVAGCIGDVMNTKPEVKGLQGAAPVQTLNNPIDGTDITMRPGGKMVMRLESNPTTGYYWQQIAGDAGIVEQISEGYLADPTPVGLVGSGGVQEFTYAANAVGKTSLTFSYQRSAEDVAETLNLKVKVIK